MTTQTNNIKTLENALISNMGSGKQAAIKLAMLIDMSRTSKDSRSLANALTRLKKAEAHWLMICYPQMCETYQLTEQA